MSQTEKTILILFPHQLFLASHFPQDIDEIHFIEDPLFFTDTTYPVNFHKQKLVFHRASIDHYIDHLGTTNHRIIHHRYQSNSTAATLVSNLHHLAKIYYFDVADFELEKRIIKGAGTTTLEMLPSPMFLNSRDENAQLFDQNTKPRMQEFYKHQRRTLDILIDNDGNPTGGQWSYDDDNRKKISKSARGDISNDPEPYSDEQVDAAKQWVEENFSNNPGALDYYWLSPTRQGALAALEEFIANRYTLFGDYEDAIDSDHWRLYHSALSPYLNCGLLTPEEVLTAVSEAYSQGSVPINAHEGFVRQIIGWREYMRAIYDSHGVSLRTANDWQHQNTLSDKWYTAQTNLRPLDSALDGTINHAYNHHIERLMVIGNAMFLCRIHPHEVYRWFMEMYLDAYDWVMVGNVYGMSQDTIDGLITTKPYFSGSNYICKMSNYSPQEDWCPIWDALYWSFIIEHRDTLAGNFRWGMMISRVDTMNAETKHNYLQTKNDYLESLSD